MTITIDVLPEDAIKLLLALLVGGLIGAEREYRDKAAGFRTMIFICIGSTLFTMFSIKIADNSDPARIAAQIVSGIGFLGGGAILRGEGRVHGLTTAATIWLVAALGMGIASDYYTIALVATLIILVVLWIFPFIERLIDNVHHAEVYEITSPITPDSFDNLHALFKEHNLHIFKHKRYKVTGKMVSTWEVHGAPRNHRALTQVLMDHDDVIEFQV
ncbi:MAG: MgtC/SapB family protein [Anaerolineae bacterium]|nr:MgtC/SapB family protein [Anaerolineae bacterium]